MNLNFLIAFSFTAVSNPGTGYEDWRIWT